MRGVALQVVVVLVLSLVVGARSRGGDVDVFAGEHERVVLSETEGAIELEGPFGIRTSRRGPGFDERLAEAARGGRLVVAVRGGGTLEVRSVSVRGALVLEAERVTVNGVVTAASARLGAREMLYVDSAAEIHARAVELDGRVVMSIGTVESGRIAIAGERVMNQGALSARGGEVRIAFSSHYLESRRGSIDVSSGEKGGRITVSGGSHLFSSGRHSAGGQRGGEITLAAGEVKLVGASLDASGIEGGGHITVGDPAKDHTERVAVQGRTTINVDGQEAGPGGTILLASADRTLFAGRVSARGGQRSGDGGFVDVSSAGELTFAGDVATDSPHGRAGRVVLDPKNITIDEPGVLPYFELVDPTPFADDLFGAFAASLSTGNVVVSDQNDDFAAVNAGAVHLFSGVDGALIATLTGSSPDDTVGTDVTVLTNGNYVVRSVSWINVAMTAPDAGAVTWGNGVTGIAGPVTAANSLVGTTANDTVGSDSVTALANGNYVVRSVSWDNGVVVDAGAVTWGNGATGTSGAVTAANSLVGTTAGDAVGGGVAGGGVTALTNGNYVVRSDDWNNGAVVDAGAVTWGNGVAGIAGAVTAANSLVGTTASDRVGATGVTALTNGNYVVRSVAWHNGAVVSAGAATWGNGATGISGAVTVANSLVGTTTNDQVGSAVTALTNGSYVVRSPSWDNGASTNAGAVTWGNGATGVSGAVTVANSLVGTTASDQVGFTTVTALTNGNYVVVSTSWDNGAVTNVGAATWGNGATGISGAVTAANSLVGTTTGDLVGTSGVTALTNGNYVVRSGSWDNGAVASAGAVTWGNGATGISGAVTVANSLVGTTASDGVGIATALTNGNYVVSSPNWDNGAAANAGAVTWGSGATGVSGAVTVANSLVGTSASDQVGTSVTALTNGNYVVRSNNWDNGAAANAGAVTWGNGATGISGAVTAANSLVGTTTNDGVGSSSLTPLTNGNYVVRSNSWDNGAATDAGAVTWGNGATGISGAVTAANSLVGTTTNDGVGSVTALTSGDYFVVSATWDHGFVVDAGALSFGSGVAGVSGPPTAANSVLGTVGGAGLSVAATEGPVAGTFVGGFPEAGSGVAVVAVGRAESLTYPFAPGQSFTIAPARLTEVLSQGSDVTLEASNDISVDAELLVDNPAGDGGHLSLSAGRRIELNASITTDGGDLTLVANDVLASGVVDGERDPGQGGISWVPASAVVDVGAGAVLLHVRDGAGKTHSTSGALHIGPMTAGSVLARSEGAPVILQGDVTAADPGDAIVLVSDTYFLADPSFSHSLDAPNGRFLVYAPSPAAASEGSLVFDFEEYDKAFPQMPDAGNTGNGILFASSPPDTSPIVSVEQAAAQVDPTSDTTITFDVVFDQDVTGFVDADVDLGLSTAGASLMAELSGGPASYTLTVSGMDSAGVVIARVPAGACDGVSGALPNATSVSLDNVVTWMPPGGAGGEGGEGGEGGAGPGGSGPAGGEGGMAAGGEGGVAGAGGTEAPGEEEGCSCAMPGSRGGPSAAWLLAALLGLVQRRARERE